jgi:hypothetical protein
MKKVDYIDFYTCIDIIDGNGIQILDLILPNIASRYEVESCNFGHAADWPVETVKIFADSTWVNGVLNLVGLYSVFKSVTEKILEQFQKIQDKPSEPTDPIFYLGRISAAAVAANFVQDVAGEDKLFLISSIELERSHTPFESKEFVVLLTSDKNYLSLDVSSIKKPLYLVHLDWREKILNYRVM